VRIENCKVGMKVERFLENHNNVRKNSIYTVKALREENVKLEETNDEYWYDLNLFRPVSKNPKPANKFEVGDEVLIKHLNNSKVEVWGKRYDEKSGKWQYAVRGCGWNDFCYGNELSPLKKKDELEKGDKFKNNGNKMEVLAVGKDDYYHHVEYYARKISGTEKGMTSLIPAHNIDEIIYE
jgi:hypothetical protein